MHFTRYSFRRREPRLCYSLGDVNVLINSNSIGVHDWLGLNTLTVLLLNKAPLFNNYVFETRVCKRQETRNGRNVLGAPY